MVNPPPLARLCPTVNMEACVFFRSFFFGLRACWTQLARSRLIWLGTYIVSFEMEPLTITPETTSAASHLRVDRPANATHCTKQGTPAVLQNIERYPP